MSPLWRNPDLRLVPIVGPDPAASGAPREIPSIDLRCVRCDTSQTYKLVPDPVRGVGH